MLLCVISPPVLVFGDEIPTEQALVVMKNLEKRICGISFSTVSTVETPFLNEMSVTYDWVQQSYLIESKKISKWDNGTANAVSCYEKISFDGITFLEWEQCVQGINLPKNDVRCTSIITNDLSDSPLNKRFCDFKNGIGLGFPLLFFDLYSPYYKTKKSDQFIYEPKCFSVYLEHWKKTSELKSIVEKDKNLWEITAEFELKFDNLVRLVIEYDIEKGGYITNIKYYSTPRGSKDKQKFFLENEFIVDTEQNEKKEWGPKSLYKIILNKDKEILFQYKNVSFFSRTSPEMFRFDLPDGTFVNDYITKRYYKVGDIVEEDKAIDRFMQRHGLTGNVPRKTTLGGIVRYVLIGAGCLLIIIALVLKILEYRGRKQ
jgi:hypothetical protein